MGTRETSRNTEKIDCNTCGQKYSPSCNYMQGRCPHHSALIDILQFKTRFTNLINFLKENKMALTKPTKSQLPDPRKHKYVSFAKSAVRIAAGLGLAGGGWLERNPYLMYGGLLLVVAELFGIVEELV